MALGYSGRLGINIDLKIDRTEEECLKISLTSFVVMTRKKRLANEEKSNRQVQPVIN